MTGTTLGRQWTRWLESRHAIYPPSDLREQIEARWQATKDRPLRVRTVKPKVSETWNKYVEAA